MKNKKLKITYLDLDDIRNPLLNAGQARATYEVAARLIKRGHSVVVISSKYPGYKDRVEDGIKYKHIGLGSRFIRLNNIFYIFSLPFIVRKLKVDIIVECFTPPFSTLFSPLFTKIPVVILPSMFNAKEFARKYHLPFHWFERLGMNLYNYITPYSRVDLTKALSMNSNLNYRIIPQGVGIEYFRVKLGKPKHILFLGRFDIAQKGIDLLLFSYAKVKDRIIYPLVIAGHGPDEKKIRNLIKDLDLGNKVKMVGPAYGVKKFQLISNAFFVAFPSKHEEISLWALEALASGLPLVIFDIPEFSWASSEVVLKAEPFNVEDYGSQLVRATDAVLINEMSRLARKFARKYDWEEVTDNFVSFFEFVLKNKRSLRNA